MIHSIQHMGPKWKIQSEKLEQNNFDWRECVSLWRQHMGQSKTAKLSWSSHVLLCMYGVMRVKRAVAELHSPANQGWINNQSISWFSLGPSIFNYHL